MGTLGLPGVIGQRIVSGIKRNVIRVQPDSGVTIDDITAGEGTWLSAGRTAVLLASWNGNGGDTGTVSVPDIPNATFSHVTCYGNGDGDTGDERMIVTVSRDGTDVTWAGSVTALDFDPSPGLSLDADPDTQTITTGTIDFILDNSHGADGTFTVDVYGYLT